MAQKRSHSTYGLPFTLITALLFTTLSCSVKEDRNLCPCRIVFDYSELLSDERAGSLEGKVIETTVFDQAGNIVSTILTDGEKCGRAEISARRGQYIATSLIYSADETFTEGRTLANPTSPGTGILFGECAAVAACSDTVTSTPEPFKQFTTLTLHFTHIHRNLSVTLHAPSSAIDRLSMSGNSEPLAITVPTDGETVAFKLLRQSGNDMTLTFSDSSTMTEIARIGLGSLLTKSGFDFGAKSLNDIDIYADLNAGTISLTVQDWQSEPIRITF